MGTEGDVVDDAENEVDDQRQHEVDQRRDVFAEQE